MNIAQTSTGTNLAKAKTLLETGKLVAIPTETVYGLAANGLDANAVARIFEAKQRPEFDPLILHIGATHQLDQIASHIPPMAAKLADAFWPGPLTIIFPKADCVPDIATSGLNTVGIRMPNHPITLELLQSLEFPLAAPSANPFGYVSPTTAQHVMDQLEGKIDYILNGGPCTIGIESTIISFQGNSPTILRHGGISQKQIESVIGSVQARTESSSNPEAPGMLVSHYAPKKKVILGDIQKLKETYRDSRYAVLGFQHTYNSPGEVLSPSGDMTEAAQNLFAALRRLDQEPIEYILTEKVPNEGLGIAINDKLNRAATKGL